jgi:short-subunit dehydrogenase
MNQPKRKILVTGASSGIGRAIAQQLLSRGDTVVGLSRQPQRLGEFENYIPEACDFSDLKALPVQLKQLSKRHKDIDAVVCCAGKGLFGCLEEFSYAQISELMNLNFTSQAFVLRAFLPKLKQRGAGRVVIMGSEAALEGAQKGSLYCASKFALRGFAQSLREECARSGVSISLVNPGMVKTEFFEDLNFAPGEHEDNYLLPEDVAEVVLGVLDARGPAVLDEINLSPLKKVVQFNKKTT